MRDAHKVTLKDIVNPVSEKVFPSKTDVGLRCINLEDIPEGSGHIASWTSASENLSAKTAFKKGDVLFGKLRPYLRKFAQAPFDGVCTTEIMVFRPKDGIAPGYVYQVVASEDFVEHNVASSYGTKMPRTDWATASAFRFSLPTIAEQRGIAEVLSALDEQIEMTEQGVVKSEAVLKGLRDSLFGPLRFLPQSSIGNDSRTFAGGTPSRAVQRYYGGGIPWVKSTECNQPDIWETEESLTEVGLAGGSAKWVPPGTTLIAMYGATAAVVSFLRIKATTNQAVLAVPAGDGYMSRFIYHWLIWNRDKLLFLAQGSGQPNLNKSMIDRLAIPVLSKEVQTSIVEALDDQICLLDAERKIAAKLRLQKQGLMRDLLTGKVRVH